MVNPIADSLKSPYTLSSIDYASMVKLNAAPVLPAAKVGAG